MNNYSRLSPLNSTPEKSDGFLSGQRAEKIALKEIKDIVNATNKAQQSYDKIRAERNRAITQYLIENDTPDAVYSLSYEIKLTPATIYKIKSQKTRKENNA